MQIISEEMNMLFFVGVCDQFALMSRKKVPRENHLSLVESDSKYLRVDIFHIFFSPPKKRKPSQLHQV